MIKIIKKLKNKVDDNGILEFPLLLDDMTDSICGKTNVLYTFSIFILSILYYTFTISLTISMFIVSIWYDIEIIYDYFNKKINKNYYKNSIIKALNKHAESLKFYRLYLYNGYTKLIDLKELETNSNIKDYKEFIYLFIIKYRCTYFTAYGKDDDGFLIDSTYPRRRRSLGDIYVLTKSYFPEVTIIDVTKELINLCESGKIYASYCTTINKYVFHTDSLNYVNGGLEWYSNGKWFDVVKEFKDESS